MVITADFNKLVSEVLLNLQNAISISLTDKEWQELEGLPDKLIFIIKAENIQALDKLIAESDEFIDSEGYLHSWYPIIQSFVRLYPLLQRDIQASSLIEFAKTCEACSRLLEILDQPDRAYNFYEFTYAVYENCEIECYNIAKKIIELSNPSNVNQYRAALWRVATQQVLKSTKDQTNYLVALDLVEAALNAPCPDEMLQENLEVVLRDALLRSETPLQNLAVILIMLSESPGLQSIRKLMACKAVEVENLTDENELRNAILNTIMQQQTSIDNYRLELLGYPKVESSITLDDQTLTHAELKAAVPMGQSLIIDINRTGKLLLDLAHEVTHAFSLLGNIGNQRMALRAATHFCELFNNVYNSGNDVNDNTRSAPLEKLPDNPLVKKNAEIQLSIMYRTTLLEAAWRPWLEGVAVYFELLSDPQKDPSEITPVFEALRGLIGLWLPKKDSETFEQYLERFERETVDKYEDFHSQAIKKFGEDIHLEHLLLQSSQTDKNNAADVYILGYILVRSVVSRWEHTLNTRLEPAIAAKLLLFLTRFSTGSYLPQLAAAADELETKSQSMFMLWLDTIARIPETELKMFFTSVKKDETGRNYRWDGGHIVPVTDDSNDDVLVGEFEQQTLQQISILLKGHPSDQFFYDNSGNEILCAVIDDQSEIIGSLFRRYNSYLTLLPIGHDDSRIISPDNTSFFLLFTRTHIGYEKQDNNNRNSNPKYSIQQHPFPEGINERQTLSDLCRKNRTGRLQCTHVIDFLAGDDSPIKVPNQSAVCYFLGDDWHLISLLYPRVEHISDEYKPFMEMLQDRIFRPGFFINEHDTLSSLEFLRKRFDAAGFQSPFSALAAFDQAAFSSRIGLEACSRALDIQPSDLDDAFSSIAGKTSTLVGIARFLNDSGQGRTVHPGSDKLSSILFDQYSPSCIKPFTIK